MAWDRVDITNNWQSPGADGANDREIQILGTVNAHTTGSLTTTLNGAGLAAIQKWINDPGTNHGIIISNSSNPDGADFTRVNTLRRVRARSCL